ncbi:MAG: AarF/ABC1/UbiB kinase family protein [Polyangiaceae bacterium]
MPSILGAVRDLNRLRQIYLVLVRHGFGEIAQRLGFGGARKKAAQVEGPDEPAKLPAAGSALLGDEAAALTVPDDEAERGEKERRTISLPERGRLVLIDLGPSFVKLGQIASTRPDILPAEWIRELKKLQDEVPPLPFEDIKAAVESSLGAPIADVFDRFDEKPLAAASIGQVHRAVLRHETGPKEVVVKIQRPAVRETVARDLELLHMLAGLIERAIPESKIYSPVALVDQFERAITSELDFKLEAEHSERFSKNFAGKEVARFPTVYKQATTNRVLTLEFFDGYKIYDAVRDRGFAGPEIAKVSVGIIIKMIFEDGFFHADPHPGNLFIMGTPAKPSIGFIDLGMVGRLSPEMREKTVDLMVAAVRQDYVGIADALYAIATPTKKVDMRAYRAEVAMLSEKYLGKPLKEINLSAMIGDLVYGATKYGLEIPPDFLLVGKALMTVEGVGKEIDPDLDVYGEARPYFLDLLKKRYSPERLTMDLYRGVERLSSAAYELPPLTREILDDLRLGRLSLVINEPHLKPAVDRLGARVLAGLLSFAFLVSGALLLAAHAQETLAAVLLVAGVLTTLIHLVRDAFRK